MTTAEQKNKKFLHLSEEHLQKTKEMYEKGKIVLMRRPPFCCFECGEKVRTLRYIGDIDTVSEWEYICENCGCKTYG